MLEQILFGVVGGASWSVLGLVKEKTKKKSEAFNLKKFLKSVIIGGAIGGIIGYQGGTVEIATIENFIAGSALYTPIVAVVDKAIGIIWGAIGRL